MNRFVVVLGMLVCSATANTCAVNGNGQCVDDPKASDEGDGLSLLQTEAALRRQKASRGANSLSLMETELQRQQTAAKETCPVPNENNGCGSNHDRHGGTNVPFTTDSWEECGRQCQGEVGCNAWVWIDPNGGNWRVASGRGNQCWLKTAYCSGKRDTGIISGRRACPELPSIAGTWQPMSTHGRRLPSFEIHQNGAVLTGPTNYQRFGDGTGSVVDEHTIQWTWSSAGEYTGTLSASDDAGGQIDTITWSGHAFWRKQTALISYKETSDAAALQMREGEGEDDEDY